MSTKEKRASLSSGLLISKDIAPSADLTPAAADDAEAAADAARRSAAALAPPAALPATMLSRKGAASAAGFRPEYWSYDRAAADRPVAPPAVVPLFSDAPPRSEPRVEPPAAQPAAPEPAIPQATASSAPAEEQTRPSVLILGLGCIAVILSTSLYWLSGQERVAEPPGLSLPAARIAASHPAEPPVAIAAANPAAPASPEIPVAVTPPAEASAAAPQPVQAPSVQASPVQASPVQALAFQPPSAQAPAVAPSPPEKTPATTLSSDEIEILVARADQLLSTGDIVAARLFFQRAAEQGSGPAATGVGKTYDPLFLEQSHVRGVRGDAALAVEWYRKAVAAGDRQGQIRLDYLTQRYP